MAASESQLTRRNPPDSLERSLSAIKSNDNTVEHNLAKSSAELNNTSVAAIIPACKAVTCAPLSGVNSNNCPCPDERKLLLDSAAGIAQYLLRELRAPKAEKTRHGDQNKRQAAEAPAPAVDCVHCGGTRPCGPGCCCPCRGFFAKRTCSETFRRQPREWEKKERFDPLPEPPEPETITECKSQQLRAGKFITMCDCPKRNGLQHECRVWGCSEKCVRLRPKQRPSIQLGDPVLPLDSAPKCCAGKLQVEMYRMMESKIDELLAKNREPEQCKKKTSTSKPPITASTPHLDRKNSCCYKPKCPEIPVAEPSPSRASKTDICKNPDMKRATGSRSCTHPLCRADCFEDPPPREPPPSLSKLILTVTPYLKQETC